MANIKKALVPKKYTNPVIQVSVYHYKYLNIFLQTKTNKLVEYQLYNYNIVFEEKKHSRFRPLYRIF